MSGIGTQLVKSTPLDRLALALHEAHLGERCKAQGEEREIHIGAYLGEAAEVIARMNRKTDPQRHEYRDAADHLPDYEALRVILEEALDDDKPHGSCITGECCLGYEDHEQLNHILRRLRGEG